MVTVRTKRERTSTHSGYLDPRAPPSPFTNRENGDVMHMSGAAGLIRAETGSLIKYFIQLVYSIFTFKFNINLRIYLNTHTHTHTHTSLEKIFTTCTPISNFFSVNLVVDDCQ